VSVVGSIERRVELLEERRVLEAIQLLFERARAASLDAIAEFAVKGFELEQAGGTEALLRAGCLAVFEHPVRNGPIG
jgi:hypothetical protein